MTRYEVDKLVIDVEPVSDDELKLTVSGRIGRAPMTGHTVQPLSWDNDIDDWDFYVERADGKKMTKRQQEKLREALLIAMDMEQTKRAGVRNVRWSKIGGGPLGDPPPEMLQLMRDQMRDQMNNTQSFYLDDEPEIVDKELRKTEFEIAQETGLPQRAVAAILMEKGW